MGPKTWNQLPASIKKSYLSSAFNKKAKIFFLEKLIGWIESLVAFFAMAFSVYEYIFWIWLINIYCHYINFLIFYYKAAD